MLILALSAAAQPATWSVDGTSLPLHRGHHPVATSVRCPVPAPEAPKLRGVPLTTLGVAVVAYSKKQGTMAWGHGSLRAVYCLGPDLLDVEYEVYRLSAWNEQQLRDEHPNEAFAASAWLTTQRGARVLFRTPDPVDGGWYAEAQASNREIYEVWLQLPQPELDAVVQRAEAAWSAQLAALRAHDDLDARYRVVRDNCTWVYRALLPVGLVRGAPVTPFGWIRRLPETARARILYPSHHLVNRWRGLLPDTTARMHPVFRRSAEIRLEHRPRLWAALQGASVALPFVGATPAHQAVAEFRD